MNVSSAVAGNGETAIMDRQKTKQELPMISMPANANNNDNNNIKS